MTKPVDHARQLASQSEGWEDKLTCGFLQKIKGEIIEFYRCVRAINDEHPHGGYPCTMEDWKDCPLNPAVAQEVYGILKAGVEAVASEQQEPPKLPYQLPEKERRANRIKYTGIKIKNH